MAEAGKPKLKVFSNKRFCELVFCFSFCILTVFVSVPLCDDAFKARHLTVVRTDCADVSPKIFFPWKVIFETNRFFQKKKNITCLSFFARSYGGVNSRYVPPVQNCISSRRSTRWLFHPTYDIGYICTLSLWWTFWPWEVRSSWKLPFSASPSFVDGFLQLRAR